MAPRSLEPHQKACARQGPLPGLVGLAALYRIVASSCPTAEASTSYRVTIMSRDRGSLGRGSTGPSGLSVAPVTTPYPAPTQAPWADGPVFFQLLCLHLGRWAWLSAEGRGGEEEKPP